MSKTIPNWWKDLMAGLVVSLIALPLGLGLATASGVPPMAGIIAAIVGGIVVSLIGGSHVSIAGPGNGLVVVILSSVMILGEGDLWLGYTCTLAAIVFSGFCMIILGYLRLGNLADFFPTATIQGMLSAIGLIIIAKQIHVMLGASGIVADNNLLLIMEAPLSFIKLFNAEYFHFAGWIGILSLLTMYLYPKIPFRSFHAVPAPMWIVIFCVLFYAYFEWFGKQVFPIDKIYLIQVPENISDSIVFPDFGKWYNSAFFVSVLGITLIASLESLLSIKAVDNLDVKRRRSNANRDLKALGIATVVSGFLGGLPVVIKIATSSVNVNNNAQSRKSNLFHALFVVLFIILFSQYLNRIPLSALAGILVFTGYKLVAPSKMRKMFKTGKDQFLIYLITLLATLIWGLLPGIIIGIIATIVIQLYLMENSHEFFKEAFKPNTLLFEEEDGKMYLSVKGYSSFFNFLQLKKQLDSVSPKKELILDYSLSTFVDNSVMEHIYNFSEEFKRKGGKLEVVGLDIHNAISSHPFAARRIIRLGRFIKTSAILSNRQLKLKEFSKEIEWSFRTNSIFELPILQSFPFFRTKKIDHAYNVFTGEFNDLPIRLMDVEFLEGELIAKEKHKHTLLIIDTKMKLPKFRLDRERIFDRIAGLAGFEDINIEGYEDFSKRFLLRGENQEEILQFFTKNLILFFESHPYYHLESNGRQILIFRGQRLASISEVKALASYGKALINELVSID